MGCLGQMNTSGLNLSQEQQTAVRALSYDRSCKIGIKFSEAWWVRFGVTAGMGGSSATDLPIRTTVYPSWIDTNPGQPAVLICSYTWALDATKIGSLIASPDDPTQNAELLALVLKNLVRVFDNKITYEKLKSLVISHHAYAWSHDPNTAGAFALFGPGQFTNLYPAVQLPAADGRFWMVGECVSAHHAWIVGALDSAYIQLIAFLARFRQLEKLDRLRKSWFGGGVNRHPDEMIDQEKLVYWKVKLSIGDDLGF
jgi:monoamine oxidase